MNKLVLVWVDNSGFELTGRFRDRLRQYPETRAIPQASAACWGDDTPEMLERLKKHVARESHDHQWMGFYSLPNNDQMLPAARARALLDAATLA